LFRLQSCCCQQNNTRSSIYSGHFVAIFSLWSGGYSSW
jgi:hypothetical protein